MFARGEDWGDEMAFEGFEPDALRFFKALAFHQSKEWFEANRETYERCVKGPMGDLVEEAAARLAKTKIPIKGDRRTSVFRIHRDVRFSNNKDPYKTNAGVAMTRTGSKRDPGVLYFHLSPEECFFAAGFHQPDGPALAKLRGAAARAPKSYKAMIAKLAKAGLAIGDEDALKRAPRGFEFGRGPSNPRCGATEELRLRAPPQSDGGRQGRACRFVLRLRQGRAAPAHMGLGRADRYAVGASMGPFSLHDAGRRFG